MHDEMRELKVKWQKAQSFPWPRMLESIKIANLRGWAGQTVDFKFPFTAIAGENGVGKSMLLQAAASAYQAKNEDQTKFQSDFFPDTTWDTIKSAELEYRVRDGSQIKNYSVKKTLNRWRGLQERHTRDVIYLDLGRIQPLAGRQGYSALAKPQFREVEIECFSDAKSERFASIIGRKYNAVRFARTEKDNKRWVPVVSLGDDEYSGFHQGSGEASIAALLRRDIPNNSLLLIDEIEASLHPRAQRRIIRDLARLCRTNSLQIIVTTHSPYVLDEFPQEGRICIVKSGADRIVLTGISSRFAMTQMDDENHPEIDLYVEDDAAKDWVEEIVSRADRELVRRCSIRPYGSCEVGKSLGIMKLNRRFERPTLVFLDGDQATSHGCKVLPGGMAPERLVFSNLQEIEWDDVPARLDRLLVEIRNAAEYAMTLPDHHDWVSAAANKLNCRSEVLWSAMVRSWCQHCCSPAITNDFRDSILEELGEKPKQLFSDRTTSSKASNPIEPDITEVEPRSTIARAIKPAAGQKTFSFERVREEEQETPVDEDDSDAKRYDRQKAREMDADRRYDSGA